MSRQAGFYGGDDRARINRLDRAARGGGFAIVAVNDVHYHAAERRPLQDVMTCIRDGVTIDDAGRLLVQNRAASESLGRWRACSPTGPDAIQRNASMTTAIFRWMTLYPYSNPRRGPGSCRPGNAA